MKIRILLTAILIITQGCFADTTSPQVSLSIAESKHRGFFVKEYYLKNSPFKDLVLEEAWIEKGSYNNQKGSRVVREAEDWCQLCFKLKQIPTSKFLIKDVLNWSIVEVESTRKVGVQIKHQFNKPVGIYRYSMFYVRKCISIDSISFNLYTGSKRHNNQEYVGTMVFYAK